ncbi:MAG: FtsX-like permease family protein [Candidatus Rokubacteria bacterium]|nr:FtsX-like permease family protein [Candidatus Rokubacteria bacterium]
MSVAFPLRMAWRQTRGAWRHFLGFGACVALGVAALVAVATLAVNLDGALTREAKTLLGGDVELRAARPLGDEAVAALERLRLAGARTTALQELIGMARSASGRTLPVEVKAVEPAYPLYGVVVTRPAAPLARLLTPREGGAGAVVDAALLERLGLGPGDRLALGETTLTITGVLVREPDRLASLVGLGPRVLVSAETLARTGLVRPGSRVRYRALVRLPGTVAAGAASADLARAVADPGVRVTSFDEAQPGLRRFFRRLATYLGLVGLASLLIGGIGIAAAVTTFVRRQRATIAVLKVLGADGRTLLATYLLQTQALGVLASLVGAALGAAAQPLLVRALAPLAPVALEARLDPWTLVRGVALGGLTALLCALWPLLEVRAVPPSLVLRRDVEAGAWRARRPWLAALPVGAGLAALAVWQAGSLGLGAIFVGAALAALCLLALVARGLVVLGRRGLGARGFALRQGLAGLARPGGHAARVVTALGLAVTLLVAVALLESALARQIALERRDAAPSFFFVDVQPDQVDALRRLLAAASGGTAPAPTPVVRARLAALDGVPLTHELIARRRAAAPDAARYLTREYVLTWAGEAPPADALTEGRWWTEAEAAARPRVSLEEEVARRLGVGVGGTLTFDVQGVAVTAEVTNLRRVDWQSLSVNFFAILSPGALDGAPATWIATARVPAVAEAGLQDRVVASFPNVTAIPVREVLERATALLGQLAWAVRWMAAFSVATGLVVVAGTLAATRWERLYESVILRTLGATRGAVARAFAVEYACLGAAAGLGGTLLAVVLAWIVVRFVLDVPWTLAPAPLVLGVGATAGLSLAVGSLATFRLLGQKPLAVLRRD